MNEDADRLQRRLERERRTRTEAERIAEETTRALFERGRELELLHAVTTAANDSDVAQDALTRVLASVCAHTGWPVGHALLLDGRRLRSAGAWEVAPAYAELPALAGEWTFGPGDGLPGRVLETGAPAWIADVFADAAFTRKQLLEPLGLRSAFAFPLLVQEQTVGVLEFFSPEIRDVDPALLTLMRQVGVQAGRVEERTRSRADLEQSNADLALFAHRVAHDLLDPIRMLTAAVDILDRHHGEQLPEAGRRLMEVVVNGSQRAQEMVQGLLDLSHAGRDVPDPDPVDLQVVLDRVLETLRMRLRDRSAVVRLPERMPVVCGSAAQLGLVFQNLFDNALKYVPDERTPRIDVRVADHPDEWELAVSDNGIGIDGDVERIFAPFERLDGARDVPGSGLGLSVAKRVVEAHDGRIWADRSADGAGATLHFTLPKSAR